LLESQPLTRFDRLGSLLGSCSACFELQQQGSGPCPDCEADGDEPIPLDVREYVSARSDPRSFRSLQKAFYALERGDGTLFQMMDVIRRIREKARQGESQVAQTLAAGGLSAPLQELIEIARQNLETLDLMMGSLGAQLQNDDLRSARSQLTEVRALMQRMEYNNSRLDEVE